jgi:large subunit ribosomal protein L4
MAFAKRPRNFRKKLPRKMRLAAVDSAILAKLLGSDLLVLDGLAVDAPKTKTVATIFRNLDIRRSCLLTIDAPDPVLHLAARNLPDVTVRSCGELNAFDIATRQKMVVTTEAMKALIAGREGQS